MVLAGPNGRNITLPKLANFAPLVLVIILTKGLPTFYHMLAMASTGSILEAFQAGYSPATKFTKIAPIITYNKNSGFMDTVNLDTR